MDRLQERLLWAALALGPSLALVLAPAAAISPGDMRVLGALSIGICVGAALVGGLHRVVRPHHQALLRPDAQRDVARSLPDRKEMCAELHHALHPETAPRFGKDEIGKIMQVSQSQAHSIAQVMRLAMARTGAPSPTALSEDDLIGLYLLMQLLQAPPGQAGALAAHFVRPDVVIALRDRLTGAKATAPFR